MLRIIAMAGVAALVTACAAASPAPGAAADPMRPAPGSSPSAEATAAEMGFHGPVYRTNKADGPN